MIVLVVNVGSTSFKCKILQMDNEQVLGSGKVERIGSQQSNLTYQSVEMEKIAETIPALDHSAAILRFIELMTDPSVGCLSSLQKVEAVGFKAVHAGDFYGPALVTEELIERMAHFNDAAPNHNPAYITTMRFFKGIMPDTPQVAVFETAFHHSIPDYAYIYSIPYEWYEKYGIRRYGFHGASLRYVSERVTKLLDRPEKDYRLIACHLGGSSSICAIVNGQSVDTSMGFTPQAGVPMGTRCGDIDPFIIPFVLDREGLSSAGLREWLTKKGGLLGISGLSADVRDLEDAAAEGYSRAELALASYAYAVRKYIGAYAAVLGGIDVLTFSGGIGENASNLRARICRGLEFLGINLDLECNAACQGNEVCISKESSRCPIWVVPTDEEIIVARETAKLVKTAQQ